ncbi:MAG: hypothetical protein L0K86_25500, partial [Actinomycetia bacterium]|nr:hypothetical protein [Actinomycetes bacterium]
MDPGSAAPDFAQLAESLHVAPNPTQTAEQVVAYAQQQVDAHYAGITLIRSGGHLETIAPSGPLVVAVDALQYEL